MDRRDLDSAKHRELWGVEPQSSRGRRGSRPAMGEGVLPWLNRLYRNVAIDVTRSRVRRQRILEEAAEVPDRAGQATTDSCSCGVSQSKDLAANYATVLGLVDVRGLQLRDAARVLGISVNNATVRLHRARAALKKRMLEHCGARREAGRRAQMSWLRRA